MFKDEDYQTLINAAQGTTAPGELAELRVTIASYYAYMSSLLEDVLVNKKPTLWLELREKCTSDNQADNHWARSADGVNETKYRLRLKAMEKLMSAIKTRLDIAQGEMRGMS